MKIKLLVIATALGMPVFLSAQTKVFLYNEGVMSIKGTDATNTTLYINGDLKTGNNTTTSTHCDITLSNSKTVLTGDFLHNDLSDDANVFKFDKTTDKSVFEFGGDTIQAIKSSNKTYATIPSKKNSFIDFPTLTIDNDLSAKGTDKTTGAVLVDPAMALKVQTINLAQGWLVLQSEIIDKDNQALKDKYLGTSADLGKRTALAHLMLDPTSGQVKYPNRDAADYWKRGTVQVNLALRTPAEAKETGTQRPITALGSPFEGMYSDYFMWNFLFAPSPTDLFGPNGATIANPSYTLTPGRGYFLGIDLRGSNYNSYSWSIQYPGLGENTFKTRATEGYKFNRSLYANETNSNNFFGSNTSSQAYTGEILNGQKDIKVKLTKGYNYLANPYTSPLNITALLTATGPVADWGGIISGPASVTNRQIMNRVWVVNNNSSTAQGFDQKDNRKIILQLSYFIAKKSGSTYTDQYNDGDVSVSGQTITIPPLQMFLVYAYSDCEITIPRKEQVMGTTTFMRSTQAIGDPSDDFLFEVVDKKTGASDRTSVVLRSNKEILEDVEYSNVVKIRALSTSADDQLTPTEEEDGKGNGFSSLIYTKSGDKFLISNYLPYSNYQSSVSTTLYLQPASTEQDVTINALRTESLKEFEEVIIKDKLTGKEKVLTPTDYSLDVTTKPTDSSDRFTLVFKRNTTGIEDEIDNDNATKSISSYYNSGILTVTGFDESDFGSTLSVYDIQGRLIKQVSVNDFTVNVSHPFVSGAYIVKVVGNNSYISKFLAK